MEPDLTQRQKNEIEYHRDHARWVAERKNGISFDVVTSPHRRMHNAYWHFYTKLLQEKVQGKNVLILGCGAGHDAMRIAKMGAAVKAFDLSPDMLELARESAESEGLDVEFAEMPAEQLGYKDDFFDYVVAVDILHHVDIRESMKEIVRVSKEDCRFFMDEIYSHSFTDRIRHSHFVERYVYPSMVKWIYKNEKPYITKDERKLNEIDIREISGHFSKIRYRRYFNFIVNRLIPDRFDLANKLDYWTLRLFGGLGRYMAGRILIVGEIKKSPV